MAFGIDRAELTEWKRKIKAEEISFLTHYWVHPKYPHLKTVTKVGCCNIKKLENWGLMYGLKKEWIHYTPYPHFDLLGERQFEILKSEGLTEQIKRFNIEEHLDL